MTSYRPIPDHRIIFSRPRSRARRFFSALVLPAVAGVLAAWWYLAVVGLAYTVGWLS